MLQALLIKHGHLVKNLIWIEVTHPFELGSGAKSTVEATTYLAGHTSRRTGFCGYQNRFNNFVVIQTHSIFDCAVITNLHLSDIGVVDYKVFVEQSTMCLGKVGHLLEINGCLLPQPLIHLIAVKRGCVV